MDLLIGDLIDYLSDSQRAYVTLKRCTSFEALLELCG